MNERHRTNPVRSRYGRAGFVATEVVAAAVLTGILLAALAWSVVTYDRTGDYLMSRHRAQLAAESCLERLRAGLPPPNDADAVQYRVGRQPGQGPWTGLTKVTVTATVSARHQRTACFTLTAYLQEGAS